MILFSIGFSLGGMFGVIMMSLFQIKNLDRKDEPI